MAPLGPFGRSPAIAIAVSGGADSLALATLAAEWAGARGGSVLALIVDHGLRPESGIEAEATAATLSRLGIPARIRRLHALRPGPALPARARAARYDALAAACREAGRLHLLLGHHARDQAETLLMRQAKGSGAEGLAGMATIRETEGLRLLRPLLAIPPGRLRATLRRRDIAWAEDPTNHDLRFHRSRLRHALGDPPGDAPETRRLVALAGAAGVARRAAESAAAGWLGAHVALRPEGFAILPPGPWPALALGRLLRMLGGAPYPPSPAQLARLAARPEPAVLGGIRLLSAGKLGPGLLAIREEAAMEPPVPAIRAARWDNRFRRPTEDPDLPGETIGALGREAAAFRRFSELPAAILATLPAFRDRETLRAVPAIGWTDGIARTSRRIVFHPPEPAAGALFAPTVTEARAAVQNLADDRGCRIDNEELC